MAFFISKLDEYIDGKGGDSDSVFDIGLYGREEFVLFAAAAGIFVALVSMVIAILGIQENSHWAATVCVIIFTMNWMGNYLLPIIIYPKLLSHPCVSQLVIKEILSVTFVQ